MTDQLPLALGSTKTKVHTVADIVALAGRALEARFSSVWVEGEVSNLRIPASGHLYFTLKDDSAQLQAVLFRSDARRLRFRIEDGQSIRCRGRLSIYEAQGKFQLLVDTAEPVGRGALQVAFEQLKAKLKREVNRFLDFHELARLALAQHWTKRTEQERKEFVDILRALIERSYLKQLRSNLKYKISYRSESVRGAWPPSSTG